ncbi:MAG TPA: FHA domain-containing protein [Pyrinomonadaceae bacterium]|nr:FHA domain-containing protein [Pyrinomonadaceae bacterium]
MITCDRCHTQNLDGAQYCDECGAVLPGQPSGPRRVAPLAPEGEGEPVAAGPAEPREAHSGRHSQAFAPARTPVSGRTQAARDSGRSAAAAEGVNAPHAKLVIHRGRSVGKEFLLNDDESHIGRWDADGGIFPDVDLDADDPEAKVSRRHARISRRGEQYFIEDLGSTNGTFVNRGRRLLPGDRQLLRDGDEVIVGKTFLRFHVLKP